MKTWAIWATIGLLYFSSTAGAQSLTDLYNEEESIDNQITAALRLTIDPEQPNLGGMNEKFLVRDQLNRRWLFKIHQDPSLDIVGKVASEMARYVDVLVPRSYVFTLTINGEARQGTLLEWIENAENMKSIPPGQLNNEQLNQLFKQQIFDHFLVNYDIRPDNFLYQSATKMIWGIDKDFAFDYWNEDLPLMLHPGPEFSYFEDYYIESWNSYVASPKQIDWNKLFSLLSYIDKMDNSFISKVLGPAFKLPKVKKNVGDLEFFLQNKAKLKDDFMQFYKQVFTEKGLPAEIITLPETDLYSEVILNQAKQRIEIKKEELTLLKEKANTAQQSFTLIISRKAWQYIYDNEREGPSKILPGLKQILKQTKDLQEQEAVRLYIKQVEAWNPKNPAEWDLKYIVKVPKE